MQHISPIHHLASVFSFGVDLLRSVDIWQSLRSTSAGQVPGLCSQGIVAGVVASMSERNERWKALAKDKLRLSEAVIRNYLANGDSVLLANFIHITRLLFRFCFFDFQNMGPSVAAILGRVSKFGIESTLPYTAARLLCFVERNIVDLRQFSINFSSTFGIFISLYIKAPMLPRPPSMLPHILLTPSCITHFRTHYAISRVTTPQARPVILSQSPPTLPTPF
ncbi:hypothetical protein BGW80DRAFT_382433 [Lactifluus volemus]|nr:hypothetical protein BGW80DRAFT_382433 [Lactifluus volemus]